MIALEFNLHLEKAGQWVAHNGNDGKRTAIITCPDCGTKTSLHTHKIVLADVCCRVSFVWCKTVISLG